MARRLRRWSGRTRVCSPDASEPLRHTDGDEDHSRWNQDERGRPDSQTNTDREQAAGEPTPRQHSLRDDTTPNHVPMTRRSGRPGRSRGALGRGGVRRVPSEWSGGSGRGSSPPRPSGERALGGKNLYGQVRSSAHDESTARTNGTEASPVAAIRMDGFRVPTGGAKKQRGVVAGGSEGIDLRHARTLGPPENAYIR